MRERGVLRGVTPTGPGRATVMRRFDDEHPGELVVHETRRARRGTAVAVLDAHGELLELRPEADDRLGLEDVGTVLRRPTLRERLLGLDAPMAGSGGSDGTLLVGLTLAPVLLVAGLVRVLRAPLRHRADVRRASALQRALESGPVPGGT